MVTLASPFWVSLRSLMLGAMMLTPTGPAGANDDEAALFEAVKKQAPMEFFVARGGPNACGPGCDRWIAAEGRIVHDSVGPDGLRKEGTTARLVSLLSQLGGSKLPIFFFSTGGDTMESLALGRALRAWQLTAGVATTLPADCPASNAENCQKLMREHPEAEAKIWSEGATCASGCAYAILGAVTREIAPGARVVVHSFLVDPNATATQRALTTVAVERGIQRYLADMRIDAELYRIAAAIEPASERVLTRPELYDLGIDRRESLDSGWIKGDIDSRKSFAFATAAAKARAAGHDEAASTFTKITLAIACIRPRRSFVVSVWQSLPNASAKMMTDFRVSAGAVGVTLDLGKSLVNANGNKVT